MAANDPFTDGGLALPSSWEDAMTTVASALESYLDENGFTTAEYTAPTVTVSLGRLSFPFPNPPTRQRVVPLHDLHHVATGYGTDFRGEAEVAAWELAAGCTTPFLYGINLSTGMTGMLLSPRRVVRAFLAGRKCRTLYRSGMSAEAAKGLTVAELRKHLGVPEQGIGSPRERRLHPRAPSNALG
jgi:hypothetical protein